MLDSFALMFVIRLTIMTKLPRQRFTNNCMRGPSPDFHTEGRVILNFGLIDLFPSAFYRLLLQALQDARGGWEAIIVCCLTENSKEGFEMMGGAKLFEMHNTEARAIASVKK